MRAQSELAETTLIIARCHQGYLTTSCILELVADIPHLDTAVLLIDISIAEKKGRIEKSWANEVIRTHCLTI